MPLTREQILLGNQLHARLSAWTKQGQASATDLETILQSTAASGLDFSGASADLIDQLCFFVHAAAFEPAVLDFALSHGFDPQKILSTRFGSASAAQYFLKQLCFNPLQSDWERISRFLDHAFDALAACDWTEEDCDDARQVLWSNVQAAWPDNRSVECLTLTQYWHSKLLAKALGEPHQNIGDPRALIGETAVGDILIYSENFYDMYEPFYADAIVLNCHNGDHITMGPGLVPVRNAPLSPAFLASHSKPISCLFDYDLCNIRQCIRPASRNETDWDDIDPRFNVETVFLTHSGLSNMEFTVKAQGIGAGGDELFYGLIYEDGYES